MTLHFHVVIKFSIWAALLSLSFSVSVCREWLIYGLDEKVYYFVRDQFINANWNHGKSGVLFHLISSIYPFLSLCYTCFTAFFFFFFATPTVYLQLKCCDKALHLAEKFKQGSWTLDYVFELLTMSYTGVWVKMVEIFELNHTVHSVKNGR